MRKRIFKGAGDYLLLKINGGELTLTG